MTASTIKSENVTNIEALPRVSLSRKTGYIQTVIDQDAIPTTSTDEVADTMLFCPIPAEAVILDVLILSDDLDSSTGLVLDWGLAYSGIGGQQRALSKSSGDLLDVDCFATLLAHQAALTTWTSVRFEADDIVDVKKEAWEVGGATSNPGGLLYVVAKVTTQGATPVAGDLVVRVDYI